MTITRTVLPTRPSVRADIHNFDKLDLDDDDDDLTMLDTHVVDMRSLLLIYLSLS